MDDDDDDDDVSHGKVRTRHFFGVLASCQAHQKHSYCGFYLPLHGLYPAKKCTISHKISRHYCQHCGTPNAINHPRNSPILLVVVVQTIPISPCWLLKSPIAREGTPPGRGPRKKIWVLHRQGALANPVLGKWVIPSRKHTEDVN